MSLQQQTCYGNWGGPNCVQPTQGCIFDFRCRDATDARVVGRKLAQMNRSFEVLQDAPVSPEQTAKDEKKSRKRKRLSRGKRPTLHQVLEERRKKVLLKR